MRNSLVNALVECVDSPARLKARRFLQGLSADELEFIAAFWGACMLEAPSSVRHTAQMAERVAAHGDDGGHKLIVLREYLGRTAAHA